MPATTHVSTITAVLLGVVLLFAVLTGIGAPPALARVAAAATASGAAVPAPTSTTADSLEAAASRAGDTGRRIAMSLIGLGFAIAAIVLSFRRDFKEAAGVFAVGLVAILLATPAGVRLLHDTVTSIFGAS